MHENVYPLMKMFNYTATRGSVCARLMITGLCLTMTQVKKCLKYFTLLLQKNKTCFKQTFCSLRKIICKTLIKAVRITCGFSQGRSEKKKKKWNLFKILQTYLYRMQCSSIFCITSLNLLMKFFNVLKKSTIFKVAFQKLSVAISQSQWTTINRRDDQTGTLFQLEVQVIC